MSDEGMLPVVSWNDLSPVAREWVRARATAEGKVWSQVLAEVLEEQARRDHPGTSRQTPHENTRIDPP
jgi:hypothetical protein